MKMKIDSTPFRVSSKIRGERNSFRLRIPKEILTFFLFYNSILDHSVCPNKSKMANKAQSFLNFANPALEQQTIQFSCISKQKK